MITEEEYRDFKRWLDDYITDPQSRREIEESGDTELLEAIQSICFMSGDQASVDHNKYILKYREVYSVFSLNVQRSLAETNYREKTLAYYAEVVRNRCRMENKELRLHPNIYYFPMCFELSDGCRVQCDFCGLKAPKLRGVFEYIGENADLFRRIITAAKEVLGEIIRVCPLYFATEPLDNKDYEKFLWDFKSITGHVPQTTTAVAECYPERVRNIFEIAGQKAVREEASVRMSVRNLNQYRRMKDIYSPGELAYVEILANNPESINRVSDAGRARTNKDIPPEKRLPYSISCIAGCRVNMVKKQIDFVEPEVPSCDFPEGLRVREQASFENADDFKEKIIYLYKKYSRPYLDTECSLFLNENTRMEVKDDAIIFYGDDCSCYCHNTRINNKAVSLIRKGKSFDDILKDMELSGADEEALYRTLNDLYMRGYLRMMF